MKRAIFRKPVKIYFYRMMIAWLLCAFGAVHAQFIPLINASFESPAGVQGTVAGVPVGWLVANEDPYGVYNPGPGVYSNEVNDILPPPAQGSQVLWMNAGNYVEQTVTNTLVANQTYTLSGAIGNRGDGYGMLSSDQEYVNLLAGNTIIAQNVNLPHPPPGSFQSWSISYTAPATGFPSGPLQVRLGQNGAGEVNYDNISLAVTGTGPVTAAPSATALYSSENPAAVGASVTFTAIVTGTGGTPAGTVSFYAGSTDLGTGTLNSSGQASLSTSTLSASGSPYSITAVYSGNSAFSGSTSSTLSQVITNTVTSALWSLTQRASYSSTPVAVFRPTPPNYVMAVDVMPNGSPGDAGNGVVWQDWCLEDCFNYNSETVHVIHVAPHPTFMEISSQVYNGSNPLPLLFGQGSGDVAATTWVAAISNNVFYILSGIGGVTDGSAASAGKVGECMSESLAGTSPVNLVSGATANVTGISLTPGDWDVDGAVHFKMASATVTLSIGATSTDSATLPTDQSASASGLQLVNTSTFNTIVIPRKQITINSTKTVYLVATCYFSTGEVSAFGLITARRMR